MVYYVDQWAFCETKYLHYLNRVRGGVFMIYPSGTNLFMIIVAFFALHFFSRRYPVRPLYGVSRGQGGELVVKPMILSALKWSLSGIALLWAITLYLPTQPPLTFLLAATLCGTLTLTLTPTSVQTGSTTTQQRVRNLGLTSSNIIATFIAAFLAWQGLLNVVYYIFFFMLLQTIIDITLATITFLLYKAGASVLSLKKS